jgi:hypothetical protein
MTAGAEVPQDRRFPFVVEQLLNSQPNASVESSGVTVESLNFGTPGYGTAQELLDYQKRVRYYKPDLVVVGYLPDNDIRNNSYALEVERAQRDAISPFFEVRDGQLAPLPLDFYRNAMDKHGSQPDKSWRGLRTVALGRMAVSRLFRDRVEQTSPNVENELEVARQIFEPSTQQADREWQSAWETTALLFEELRAAVTADGASLHVAVLTGPCAVQPTCRSILLEGQQGRRLDWSLPHVMSDRMLSNGDFAFTLLFNALQKERASRGERIHFPVDGHYTELGHQMVAERLADELRRYLPAAPSTTAKKKASREQEI